MLCARDLSVSELYVRELWVRDLCVCVCDGGAGRRTGVHDQKQESHAKMWENTSMDIANDFDVDICLAVGFICFRLFVGFPSLSSMIFSQA